MPRARPLLALAIVLAVLGVAACSRGTRSEDPLAGRDGWDDHAAGADVAPWLDGLAPDEVVLATSIEHRGNEVDAQGIIEYAVFDLTVEHSDAVPEALRSAVTGELTVAESLGVEGRPSVFREPVGSAYVVVSRAGSPATEDATGTEVQLDAAFTVSDDQEVTFLGPDAAALEEEIAEARQVAAPAGRAGDTDLAFVMALLAELAEYEDVDPDDLPADSILGLRAAAGAAADDPTATWYATPPAQRNLDAANAPPEVVERMATAQVFLEVVGDLARDAALDIVTEEGVIVGVLLEGGATDFGDGYAVLTPPGGAWQVTLTAPDAAPRTLGEVPAAAWTPTGHVLVRVAGEQVTAQGISPEDFTERLRSAGTEVEGQEPEPGR